MNYTGSGAINVSGGLLASAVGATLTPGSMTLTGGTAQFAGNVNTGSLTMDGGTLGGPGTVTASTLTFTAGTMGENTSGESGGTTTVTGAATFDGAQAQYLYYGRALNLDGGATWTNAAGGTIGIYTGGESTTSTLSIASGTTFTDQGTTASTGARYLGSDSDGVVSNAGTYLRSYVVSGVQSALGTTNVNAAFNNTGTVEVAGGTLNLQNGGSSTGTLQSDSAATLQFSGGTFNVTGGSLTDNGTLLVSGGTLNIGSGVTYTGSGAINVSGGLLASAVGATLTPGSMSAHRRHGAVRGQRQHRQPDDGRRHARRPRHRHGIDAHFHGRHDGGKHERRERRHDHGDGRGDLQRRAGAVPLLRARAEPRRRGDLDQRSRRHHRHLYGG